MEAGGALCIFQEDAEFFQQRRRTGLLGEAVAKVAIAGVILNEAGPIDEPPAPHEPEALDLEAGLCRRVFTLQSPPAFVRGAWCQAFHEGLRLTRGKQPKTVAAGLKLFLMAPRMMVYRGLGQARIEQAGLACRVEQLAAKQWLTLLDEAAAAAARRGREEQWDTERALSIGRLCANFLGLVAARRHRGPDC